MIQKITFPLYRVFHHDYAPLSLIDGTKYVNINLCIYLIEENEGASVQ